MTNQTTFALIATFICCLGPVPRGVAQPGNAELLALVAADAKTNAKKDEYETTEAYQKRLSTHVGREFLLSAGLNPNILSKSRAFSYNADSQTLTVTLIGPASRS
jgi:hypothetical protein